MPAPWLKDPQAVPYSRINYAAVGSKEIDKGQLHASILYQGSGGKLCGLHLCWHYLGKHEEPAEDGYFWVQLGLPKSKAKSLASFCRLVAEQRHAWRDSLRVRLRRVTASDPASAVRNDNQGAIEEFRGSSRGPPRGQGARARRAPRTRE